MDLKFSRTLTMRISVVWNVTPCSLVDVYRLGRKRVSIRQGGEETFQDVNREMV